ncbi:hypothetical protein [Dawidia soli]|uniref:hypothetical protein n=1 Tax=Dawidia soli TaxID=2782352 RepID=UPI0020B29316|nr:hypothetical protein [Dawidia soli]
MLLAVALQLITGVRLLVRREAKIAAEKIQAYSGLYLAFFLVVHMGGVMTGRFIEHLDTNFYYAGVGMNYYPATFLPLGGIDLATRRVYTLHQDTRDRYFVRHCGHRNRGRGVDPGGIHQYIQ